MDKWFVWELVEYWYEGATFFVVTRTKVEALEAFSKELTPGFPIEVDIICNYDYLGLPDSWRQKEKANDSQYYLYRNLFEYNRVYGIE